MGCCCCKGDNKEKNDNKGQTITPTPKGGQTTSSAPNKEQMKDKGKGRQNDIKRLFKAEIDDIELEQKKVIDDERLEKELKLGVKGGESAYGRFRTNRKEPKKKGLSASNYNPSGLVDKQSKEFATVREFMATKSYQLMESIGSGNYAEVYKAFMPERNRYVAVKVIDLTKTNENYRLGFLPREIGILRQLRHPGIVKTYEVSQTENRIYMIMEFCAKGTVTDWLREKGSFGEPTAWEMFRRILDALNYMHTSNIAHRDLKLENILITDKLYPKLSDFSYSVIVDKNELNSTTFCGSLPYFAPEILQQKPHNPLMTDVWGLGVCFYVMVCDGLPFKIDDEKAMLNKQLERDWDFKKRVQNKLSSELKAMIRKMLEPDVSKRATTQALMEEPWIKNKPKPID